MVLRLGMVCGRRVRARGAARKVPIWSPIWSTHLFRWSLCSSVAKESCVAATTWLLAFVVNLVLLGPTPATGAALRPRAFSEGTRPRAGYEELLDRALGHPFPSEAAQYAAGLPKKAWYPERSAVSSRPSHLAWVIPAWLSLVRRRNCRPVLRSVA